MPRSPLPKKNPWRSPVHSTLEPYTTDSPRQSQTLCFTHSPKCLSAKLIFFSPVKFTRWFLGFFRTLWSTLDNLTRKHVNKLHGLDSRRNWSGVTPFNMLHVAVDNKSSCEVFFMWGGFWFFVLTNKNFFQHLIKVFWSRFRMIQLGSTCRGFPWRPPTKTNDLILSCWVDGEQDRCAATRWARSRVLKNNHSLFQDHFREMRWLTNSTLVILNKWRWKRNAKIHGTTHVVSLKTNDTPHAPLCT